MRLLQIIKFKFKSVKTGEKYVLKYIKIEMFLISTNITFPQKMIVFAFLLFEVIQIQITIAVSSKYQLNMTSMSASNFGQNPLSNYQRIEIIGKGAYGEVQKARDKKTKEIVAIKRIIHEMENEGLPSTSIRQISLLREIDHKNVVTLKDVVVDQKQLYIVFEYLETDLKSFLEVLPDNKFLEPIKVKKFLYQMLAGVADCHMKRVIHRDLKPANILLDKNENIKIADFGLARTFSVPVRPYSQQVVTLWYRAPELLLGAYDYTTPIDIWAIGCIFMEMITKKPLFPGDRQLDQLFRIFRLLGTPNQQTWPGVTQLRDYKSTFPNYPNQFFSIYDKLNLDVLGQDLLRKMLTYNPQERITARAAMQHPYFKDIRDYL